MLRIIQQSHVGGAKRYFGQADYYLEGQEIPGRWRGEGARRLGLGGDVKQPDWDALCDNLHPQTHEQLTLRQKSDRTVGYDFNFHVPKSVSLLYGMTRDERLLEAFRDAVDRTMQDIEAEMRTRVRKAGKNEDRVTGNMAWGEFIHLTSRPVQGIPDPHLHAHCFVFNTTVDEKENAWKAGQFRELKRDAPYFEAVFHSRLSHRLAELGLPIERTRKGWELAGLTAELLEKFSRRTALIEKKASEKGITDPEEKAELGSKTREPKQKNLTLSRLQSIWREWMSMDEYTALAELALQIGRGTDSRDPAAASLAVDHALKHSFERKSVVPERHVLATALRQAVGKATVEEVLREASASELIIGERNGRRMATTREVLVEEKRVLDFARKGRGTCAPFQRKKHTFERQWLNDGQKKAVEHILKSHDRLTVVRGAAGVGKTSLMKEAVDAIEKSGTRVFAFAPSAEASRGVLATEGFKADTVARLLVDEELQKKVAGQLIWVDEAGLLGMKTMAHLVDLADRIDARLLLTGDKRQHGAVERGAALRLLEEEAGILPAEVKEIQRQKGEYKEAVHALSEGRTLEGFDRLDKLGWVKEVPNEDRYRKLAAEYLATTASGKTALVVSPTHAEGRKITAEIREALRRKKKLEKEECPFVVLENANLTEAERGDRVNYAAGAILQFHQNAKGFIKGERLMVGNSKDVPIANAARFQVFRTKTENFAPGDLVRITHNGFTADGAHRLTNGSRYQIRRFDGSGNIILDNGWRIAKDFGHIAHGYVVSSHASQGKTVDVVLIGQSSQSFLASSQEQFYVSASRARHRVAVYTESKNALREAINQSDDRLSATEFVKGEASPQIIPLRQQQAALMKPRPEPEKEMIGDERERA